MTPYLAHGPALGQERRVRGPRAARRAARDGLGQIRRHPGQAALLVLAVAIGVALALAIIAASRGIHDQVSTLLAIKPRPPQIRFEEIDRILNQSRGLLTNLAFLVTAALAGVVTGLSISRRRRLIGIKRQYGLHVWEIVVELVVEATVLCLIGGALGVWLGQGISAWVRAKLPELRMVQREGDVWRVVPIALGLSLAAILVVALFFALRPSSEQDL